MMGRQDSAGTPGSNLSRSTPGQRLAYLTTLKAPMTQADFARRIGSSATAISEVKNGKRKPPGKMAYAIQGVFGYSAGWLLTGNGSHRVAEPPGHHGLRVPSAPPGRPSLDAARSLNDPTVPLMVPHYACRNCMGEVQYPARVCQHCGQNLEWPGPVGAGAET